MSGCSVFSNGPENVDFRTKPETRSNIKPLPKLRVNYLARYMIDEQARTQVTNKVFKTDLKSYSKSFWSPTASMAGDVITESNNSMLGVGLSLGFVVAGHLMDGAYDHVSGFLIPTTYKGEKINTPELAVEALTEITENRLNQVAKQMNWSVKCLKGCNETSYRLYEFFDKTGTSPLPDSITYKPTTIVAWMNFNFQVRKVEDEVQEVLNAFTNKDIRWKNQYIAGYSLHLLAPQKFDSAGTIVLDDKDWPVKAQKLYHYRIGREMLRMFYNDCLSFYGTKSGIQDKVFLGGNMYVMKDLFSEYITEDPAFGYTVEAVGR